MKAELCIDSFRGAVIADKYGFDSIEINSALSLGGLTPNITLVRKILKNIDIETICMVRNRPAGFNYSDDDFIEMMDHLDLLLEENITGISFGFLTENFEIDIEKTKVFVDKIHSKNKIAVFHRAFDNTKDFKKSLHDLIDLGVDRVLTSGQKSSAIHGINIIREMIEIAKGKIQVNAGAGLNSKNIDTLINNVLPDYVHSSCSEISIDLTTNLNVTYSVEKNNNGYKKTSEEESKNFILKIKELGKEHEIRGKKTER